MSHGSHEGVGVISMGFKFSPSEKYYEIHTTFAHFCKLQLHLFGEGNSLENFNHSFHLSLPMSEEYLLRILPVTVESEATSITQGSLVGLTLFAILNKIKVGRIYCSVFCNFHIRYQMTYLDDALTDNVRR